MLHIFEEIKIQLKAKNAFVAYRKPNSKLVIGLFQNDAELHYVKDFTETGFVFAPFDGLEKSILIKPKNIIKAEYQVRNNTEEVQLIPDAFPQTNAETFHKALVTKAITEIETSELKKVVLSRKIEIDSKKLPLELFTSLLENYANAFCYLWYHPKVGMWLGATPEVLLKAENNSFETSSLAATQVFMGNENPSWGTKETEEQELVTKFITTTLTNKVTSLIVGERSTIKAGNLLHLRTLIKGRMHNNFAEIISALHPTPATCGLPKQEAKKFILENENYQRKFYTGFLGELNFKKETHRSKSRKNIENRAYSAIKTTSSLFVNLRCTEVFKKNAAIYVGGGITAQSNSDKEWEETVAKSKTMLQILLK